MPSRCSTAGRQVRSRIVSVPSGEGLRKVKVVCFASSLLMRWGGCLSLNRAGAYISERSHPEKSRDHARGNRCARREGPRSHRRAGSKAPRCRRPLPSLGRPGPLLPARAFPASVPPCGDDGLSRRRGCCPKDAARRAKGVGYTRLFFDYTSQSRVKRSS